MSFWSGALNGGFRFHYSCIPQLVFAAHILKMTAEVKAYGLRYLLRHFVCGKPGSTLYNGDLLP